MASFKPTQPHGEREQTIVNTINLFMMRSILWSLPDHEMVITLTFSLNVLLLLHYLPDAMYRGYARGGFFSDYH